MADLTKTSGAASTAPHRPSTGAHMIRRSTFAVDNVHSAGLGVKSFAPGADPALFAKGKALFDRVLETPTGVPNLDGWETESAFANRAQMVVAANRDNLVGMLLYHPDTRGDVLVRSVAVDPNWSGMRLGSAMIAAAIVHAPTVFGAEGVYRCSIREMPNGELNWASLKSFEKLGFELETGPGISYLDGRIANRLKWATAELDEIGAVFIRYRTMVSTASTPQMAREFLAEWSEDVLPIEPCLRIR